MSSNNRILPFLTTRCIHLIYQNQYVIFSVWISNCHFKGARSAGARWLAGATWSANMSSNSKNLQVPLLAPLWGVGLPVHLPIYALTVEIWNSHSWPLEAFTGGRSATWSAQVLVQLLATRYNYQEVHLPNLNTLYISYFASQRSFHFYKRPIRQSKCSKCLIQHVSLTVATLMEMIDHLN